MEERAKTQKVQSPPATPKPEPKDGDLPPLGEKITGIPPVDPKEPVVTKGMIDNPKPAPAASKTMDHTVRKGLTGKLWYKAIRDGKATIDDAIPYWEAVVEDSHQHLAFKGELQDLLTEHPGLAFFYRSILTDAQQIRRFKEMKAEQVEVEKYKWLMTSEDAKKKYGTLKTTEAGKFAKAEEEVIQLQNEVRAMANIEHHLDNVALGFQDRGIMLSHIRAVREAGHQEVFIDSRIETDNR